MARPKDNSRKFMFKRGLTFSSGIYGDKIIDVLEADEADLMVRFGLPNGLSPQARLAVIVDRYIPDNYVKDEPTNQHEVIIDETETPDIMKWG